MGTPHAAEDSGVALSGSGAGAPRSALRGPRSLFVYLALAVSLALNAACLEHVLGGARLLPLLGFQGTPVAGGLADAESALPSAAASEAAAEVPEANESEEERQEEAAAGYPFAFPGVDECGLWAPNYTRVHTKILRRKQAQKFITLLPSGRDGDIGSSLMGVVSVFLAALLTNRAIVITDPNVLNAFDPAGVDWRAGPDVPMTATAGERGRMPEPGAAVENSVLFFDLRNDETLRGARAKQGMVRFPDHMLEFFAPFERAANLLVEADGGVLAKIFGFNSRTFRALFYTWGFRLPTAFGCILRFLMRPKPEVLRLLVQPLAALRNPNTRAVCVGLHGTAGVAQSDLALALNATLDCAGNIEDYWFPPAWKVYWLLATDSESLAALASTLVPSEKLMVVSNATRAEGSGEEGPAQIWSRAAQWLLFAQCQYYAFADSNFCKSSFGFNIGAPLMFQYPPLGEPMKAACEASHGHSLLSLVEWHGL